MTIFLITAPSGAGKTSLVNELSKSLFWNECISHTTRPMRKGEIEGKTYYYIDEKSFLLAKKADVFAEAVMYDGHHYGISNAEILRVEKLGRHIAIIVEYDGYTQIKEKYPDAVGVFLYMSKEDCMANMLLRGDTIKKANDRIEKYDEEIENRGEYDYVIKNIRDKFSETAMIVKYIVNQHKK